MGTVFKKTVTRALPDGADIFNRSGELFARWKNRKGKKREAKVTTGSDGQHRICDEAATYTAKYRDGAGQVREVPTGCKDLTAARAVLVDLEKRAENVRSGIVSAADDATLDYLQSPLTGTGGQFEDYLAHLGTVSTSKTHRDNVERHLNRVAKGCRFNSLADLDRSIFEKWLNQQTRNGMGARLRNQHLAAILAFANWCTSPEVHRLASNPFAKMAKADEGADCRRKRRAMSEGELIKLLDIAKRRPLLDALTIRRGKNKGKQLAKLRPDVVEDLQRLGRERALIYKTLVLTGLRKGELASLTVAHCHLDGPTPYADLDAADEKNREGSQIALRADLAADLAAWVKELARGKTHAALASTPLFNVPEKLIKILDRDLAMAGISKKDDRGRTIDVHALRHSFGTLLSRGGVAPRTAQAAMRHSTIDLTMNTYTDPRLLDIHAAVAALPALPLDGSPMPESQTFRATGTDDLRQRTVAPTVAPTIDKPCKFVITTDKIESLGDSPISIADSAISRGNACKQEVYSDTLSVETKGIEPSTPGLQSRCSPN